MALETSLPLNPVTKSNVQRLAAVLLWVVVIALSSTSFAGRWADIVFDQVASAPWFHFHSLDMYWRSMIHFLAEKDFHLWMYSIFAALLYWSLGSIKSKAAWVLGMGAAVGIGSEILQSVFPGRDPTVRDALINLAGTGLGVALCYAAARLSRTPEKSK
jgi:VanZ family protein